MLAGSTAIGNIVEANIKKVDTTALATLTSPVKMSHHTSNNNKEVTFASSTTHALEESTSNNEPATRAGQHSYSIIKRPGQ